MNGQVHGNLVLYKNNPEPGHRYRQIVVVQSDQSIVVYMFEGDVIQTDPQFMAGCSDADAFFHPTLDAANDNADREFQRSKDAGWHPVLN